MKGDAPGPGGHTPGPEPPGPGPDASRLLVRLPRRLLAAARRRRRREPARSRPAWLGRPLTARGLPMLALLLAALTLPSSLPAGLAGGLDTTDEAARALGLSLEEWNYLQEQAWQRGRQAAAEAAGQQPVAEAVANGPGAAPSMLTLPQGGDHRIPALALRAYHEAAAWAGGFRPGCGLSWSVLAGIGRLESNHGRHWGSATRFSPDGLVSPPITGPALNGRGVASIPDTDGGRWDGDRTWDRAVGPMQFIPSTWRRLRRDGNGDRLADPNNLFDAATSAAGYLCLVGGDLSGRDGLRRAVYGYNHSWAYVDAVLGWASRYAGGVAVAPAGAAGPPGAAAAPPSGPSPRPGPTTARRPGPAPTTARAAPGPSTTTTRPPTSSSATTTFMTSTTTPSTTTTTGPCATTTTTSTTTTAPTTTTLPPCSP